MDDEQQHPHDHPPIGGRIGGGSECLLCPVCVLLQALSGARPEVTRHLLAAGRELTLAIQALVEEQARAYERADQRLEHIPVD